MTLFHSPLEQKRHQISSQGSKHVRVCAVVSCSQSRIQTSDHDTTSGRFQHGKEEPRWKNGTSLCCAQGKSQYHELSPHNKVGEFARDTWSSAKLKVSRLVVSSTPTSSTFGRKTITKKIMPNKPLYIWPPREWIVGW